jgi:hypothetical protein
LVVDVHERLAQKTLLSKGYIEADVVMAMDTRHALCLSSLVRPVTCFELPAHH